MQLIREVTDKLYLSPRELQLLSALKGGNVFVVCILIVIVPTVWKGSCLCLWMI